MKVRIKFKKTGIINFIGHLDVMRYFQKVNRRADVDIAYSGGFSPHQIMSFASPLGLGLTSEGEYLDMEVKSSDTSEAMVKHLNQTMVEGIEVLSYRRLPDTAKPAMAIVAAADYLVTLKEEHKTEELKDWTQALENFFSQSSILIWKKTKKSEKQVDIRPLVYEWKLEKAGLFLKLASGSSDNLKPELLLEAFFQYLEKEYDPYAFLIHRLELYADLGTEEKRNFVSLEEMGEEVLTPVPCEENVEAS